MFINNQSSYSISKGPYAAEKLTDFSYSIAAYGIFIFYHYGILEFFAVVHENSLSFKTNSKHFVFNYYLQSHHLNFPFFFLIFQTAQVNLNHMICPAILDPFQGANYRLIACMHQMLLCPIVSKFFGYMFSTPTTETSETIRRCSSQIEVHDIKLEKNVLHRQEVEDIKSCQIAHSILADTNNGSTHTNVIWPKTLTTALDSYNECNAQNVNGKQIENGCDILSDSSIQCPNDSNKKTQ